MVFKKADLETGMIVETRQKELFVFFKSKNGNSVFLNEENMILLRDYRSDFTSKMSILDDIVKIYDIPNNFLSDFRKVCSRENIVMNAIVDWETVPIDASVIYSYDGMSFNHGHFARFHEGKIYIYKNGGTSWTKEPYETFRIDPRHVRLWEKSDTDESTID